jgi:ribonuclease P/MRP protein subunit POP5
MVRTKNRYILFEVYWEREDSMNELNSSVILQTVRTSIETNFGDLGVSSTLRSLSLKYFDSSTNTGIIRVTRKHQRLLHVSLTLIHSIDKTICCVKTLHIGGSIRSCQEAAIKNHRNHLLR